MGTIMYKYGMNRSLDKKNYVSLLNGMSAWAAHVKLFMNETLLVQKVVYIQAKFALFFNNALPHQR